MLVAPLLSGAMVGGWHWYQLPLAILVVAGYLTFNAATWWVKLPPARRHHAIRPLAVYASVAAVAGVLVLATAGLSIVGWLPVLAVPLVLALGFTAHKKERSIPSGMVTTFTASTLAVVAVAPDLWLWIQQPSWPVTAAAFIDFGYFAGTVWSVKSMIRERGNIGFLAASVAWHTAWLTAAVVVAALGVLPWFWVGFFTLTFVRALALPLVARRHRVSPPQIGGTEIALTVLLLVGFAIWR